MSYLVGVVELASQGDDGTDFEDVLDMMNAYLPGFERIHRYSHQTESLDESINIKERKQNIFLLAAQYVLYIRLLKITIES